MALGQGEGLKAILLGMAGRVDAGSPGNPGGVGYMAVPLRLFAEVQKRTTGPGLCTGGGSIAEEGELAREDLRIQPRPPRSSS